MAIKLLLPCYLFIHFTCFAQSENDYNARISVKASSKPDKLFITNNRYQATPCANDFIKQVDSIAHSPGIARHFGDAYTTSMVNIAAQMQSMDSAAMFFIKKFEATFADYFLNACFDNESGNLSATSEWRCYFSNSAAEPWRLVLLGVNTHINADMWRSLVDVFSEKEIRQNKKQFLVCQSAVSKEYDQFFDTVLTQNKRLRFINSVTFGLPKFIGGRLLYKWRRRSINLAIMYYYDPEKFKRKRALVQTKKQKIDKRILRY